jgi:DNA polymerase elongation subunit (family B)
MSLKKVVEYVCYVIAHSKHRKVPLHEIIIWKTLTKTPDDYAIKAPHVQTTNMLKEKTGD